jgi:hypothetical protein
MKDVEKSSIFIGKHPCFLERENQGTIFRWHVIGD